MKLSIKRFKKLRDKSTEGSKKDDYKLINSLDGRDNLSEAVASIRMKLYGKKCPHDNVGCDLPHFQRLMTDCKTCPIN